MRGGRAAALAVAGCLWSTLAQGRDDPSIDEFLWGPEVAMVTATREVEHPYSAPATALTVTREMIRQRGYVDLKDVLEDLPGFDVSTDVYGEFATLVSLRGVGGNNKIVLLQDGEELTAPSGKQFPFGHNVPVAMAERIEVVYGPAAAIYGPDAFGVVNVITRAAGDLQGIEVNAGVGGDATRHASVHAGGRLGRDVEVSLFLRRYHTDGQDLSGRYPELAFIRSGYPADLVRPRMADPADDWNAHASLRLGELTLGLLHSSYREQLADGLIPEHYVYGEEAYWGHTISRLYLQHERDAGRWRLRSRASLAVYEIDPDMAWHYLIDEGGGSLSTLKVHQYGRTSSATFESQLSWSVSEDVRLLGGVVAEDVTGLGVGDVYGAPFDRSDPLLIENFGVSQAAIASRNLGLYGQLRWLPSPAWQAVIGSRYDHNSTYGGVHNPRIALIYRPAEQQTYKMLYGEAYIAPSHFDRFETWFVEEYGHIQNPDLKPEVMRTVELNHTRSWNDRLELSLSLYRNEVENLIVRRFYGLVPMADAFVDADGDGLVAVEWSDNYGSLRSYGLDARGEMILRSGLSARLYYSYMDGSNTDPNTGRKLDLFKTSTHKVMAGATWVVRRRLSLSPRLRWVSDVATRQENALFAGARMPGYWVAGLHARMADVTPGLDLSVAVTNLTDRRYYTAGVRSESSVYLPRVPQDDRHVEVRLHWHPEL